jgi:Flp pilus assembly protein TadD
MTWKDFAIANYLATKDHANDSRRQAQRLLVLQSKRSNPKLNSQVNHNKVLLGKKRK